MKRQINSADEKMIIDVAKYLLNDKRIMGLLSKLNASPSDYVSGTWMKIKDIDFSSVNSPKAYIRRTMINLIYDDAAKEGIIQPKKRPNRIPYASKVFIDDGFEDLDDDDSAKSKQTKSDNMLSTTDDYAVDRTDTDRIVENAIGYYAEPGELYQKISKALVRRKGFNSQLWLTAVLAELNGTGIGKAIADYASTHPLDTLSKISSIFYRNRNKVEELTADERYDLLNDLKCSYPVQPGK